MYKLQLVGKVAKVHEIKGTKKDGTSYHIKQIRFIDEEEGTAIEIGVPDEFDISKIEKGKDVTLSVEASIYKEKVSFRVKV